MRRREQFRVGGGRGPACECQSKGKPPHGLPHHFIAMLTALSGSSSAKQRWQEITTEWLQTSLNQDYHDNARMD
jgi:hypothetical protein